MTVQLELSVLQRPRSELGFVAGFAVTDELVIAAGGTSSRGPTILASSNVRHFEPRSTPRELGLRDVLSVGDAVWVCGEYGQLAASQDAGASWQLVETGSDACMFALAQARDGAVWVVGDAGYCARVHGERLERVDVGTDARLSAVYAIGDELAILGADGNIYRWRHGEALPIATGATRGLSALVRSKLGTWIAVGDGGFIARSPDGSWFSRVRSGVEIDLEAIATCSDGRLVCVGDRGIILVSSDDGRTWQPIASDLTEHLWAVERFGGGVLIGGDNGLIARLAPVSDDTWSDRINVFGGARPLDTVFAAGPDGFIDHGLAAYLAAVADASERAGDDDAADELGAAADDDAEVREVFEILRKPGGAAAFEQTFGVPMPAEAAAFGSAVRSANPWSTFKELRLDCALPPDVGDANLFELLVRRDQHDFLGTGLVEAFCGVFRIGSLDNGDTYHMELYEWDGPRQVLHFDHDDQVFTGVFADSLDSLVYLAALARARDDRTISDEAYAIGLRKLRARVAPTWHFAIDGDDPGFVRLDPKRRDTEFFFYRSRWIWALLENDGITSIEDIPRLFNADFNQVVPQDQLPARFEACEKFNPTALYSIWRAYLFDEPELARYLEIGRRHRSRIVRDAARLVDELRAGRNQLGTIDDVRAHVARFRALDLDPRRADARKAEAAARARLAARRRAEVEEELARTPPAGWAELAWRWLDDGVAHRALLRRLDARPDTAEQIAALDELRDVSDEERELVIARLASELSPELEAILVGSLVRGDALEGVLVAPAAPGALDDGDVGFESESEHEDVDLDLGDDTSPGWDAIDRALAPVYGDAEPHAHYGTVLPYVLGGNDPLHGISVYLRDEPVPHFHFVTYGFTDLFDKETDDPEVSGFGFELTLRIARGASDDTVPTWALDLLQNLARYVFGTGNRFGVGHKMGLNGPIALEHDTELTAILFAEDSELGEIVSPHGSAQFLQVVGITDDEYRLIQEWSTAGLVDILRNQWPALVTDLARASVLADPSLAAEVRRRVDAEGSSEDLSFAGEMSLVVEGDGEKIRIELGALYAASLPRAMRGRLRLGRGYTLRGRNAVLHLEPGDVLGCTEDGDTLTLVLTPELVVEIEARLRHALAGTYRFELWPALELVVTPTLIRDQSGRPSEVRGVTDRALAQQMIAEENARLDAEAADDDDLDDEEDDERAGDHDHDHGEDDEPPAPDQILAALAMTERALRLAPGDDDTQFTHAMLLLDAERAGMSDRFDELLHALPHYTMSNRLNIAMRLGKRRHPRFGAALDAVLTEALPARVIAETSTTIDEGELAGYGDVAEELFEELGQAVLQLAPDRMVGLVPLLPANVTLLSSLGWKAIQTEQRDHALALYERMLELPVPDAGEDRTNYLRAMNNACVQAHAAKAYDTAVRIADRAQPYAHENPYIYHSAACAYAAAGDYAKAFEQVKLAVEHDYDHLGKVEVDTDLGQLLEWPEFKALFRDWRARQEGN